MALSFLQPLKNTAHGLGQKTLDLLLPPLCLSCDAPVSTNQTLCPSCWGAIHFLSPPFCACCGIPFTVPVGDDMLCGACLAEPPAFHNARAVMLYDDASKPMILHFKHSDRTHTARAMAHWMARSGHDSLMKADVIAPVPLHRWRLFKRRYNQSALLATAISDIANKPVWVDLLQRIKDTPTQGRLNRKQRHANVLGAFALNPVYAKALENKAVVLIDDVLTTGATVNECSRILLKAGAASVSVLSLARVNAVT